MGVEYNGMYKAFTIRDATQNAKRVDGEYREMGYTTNGTIKLAFFKPTNQPTSKSFIFHISPLRMPFVCTRLAAR